MQQLYIPTLYIDMDGVVADFNGFAATMDLVMC